GGRHAKRGGPRRIGLVGSAKAQQMVAAPPLGGRFGRPEDIAPVVVFLVSDEAAWLTGERISASGGARESRAMCFGRVRGNGRLVMGSPQVPSGDERRPRATAQPHVGCAQRMVVETGDDETDAGDLRNCATLAMRNSRVPTKGEPMSQDSRQVRFGLWYDFRNPPQWRQASDRLYGEILDQIAWGEHHGFDDVWMSEHHFIDDGYLP